MTDKELIKQEIERLKNHTLNIQKSKDGLITSVGRGRVEAFNDILKFIDSIPEEPGCEVNFTTKSEDLEEYYKKEFLPKEWFANLGQRTISQFNFFTAQHFAEWQKEKDQETIELAEDHAMLAGMNKMKEEMMENAIESLVEDWCGDSPEITIPLNPQDFKTGDKVKIIIVKEKQK